MAPAFTPMPPEPRTPLPIHDQVSSGGVVFRREGEGIEVVLVSVGARGRWQLPKGLVDPGETPEQTAIRETREEAGVEADLVGPLDTIAYWYVGTKGAQRVRFHKRVFFFLLAYRTGDVRDHDHEVNEARWVPIAEARAMLAFKNERAVVEQAEALLAAGAA